MLAIRRGSAEVVCELIGVVEEVSRALDEQCVVINAYVPTVSVYTFDVKAG